VSPPRASEASVKNIQRQRHANELLPRPRRYDITDAESFSKVQKWIKELRKIVGTEITIVIAGNKVDLERNRQVDEAQVFEYCKSVGAKHFYTSAKQNVGLSECFNDLAKNMVEKKKAKFGDGVAGLGGKGGKKQKLVVLDDVEPTAKKGGCC
jgi:Ras-related protein Rab-21